MAERIFIRDMGPAQFVEGVFAIHNCQLGQTKNGKFFLKCLLSDRSHRVAGRMWNASEDLFHSLPTDGFVWIAGQTQPYQGEMQIIVERIQTIEPSDDDLAHILPRTEYNIGDMFKQLCSILGTIQDPALKGLAQHYLADEPLMHRFVRAPAAMSLHHAYIGGLLEHTVQVLRLAEVCCPLYAKLNRDVVLFGLFLHDLGKCRELTWDRGLGYSDEGQLVGHVAQGLLGLEQKVEQCRSDGTPVSPRLHMVLQHIILSHHGQAEYGALKVPATPEAIMVSILDNLDAKLHMAIGAARNGLAKPGQLGGNFTEKLWALDTRIYRPDPTEEDGDEDGDSGVSDQ